MKNANTPPETKLNRVAIASAIAALLCLFLGWSVQFTDLPIEKSAHFKAFFFTAAFAFCLWIGFTKMLAWITKKKPWWY